MDRLDRDWRLGLRVAGAVVLALAGLRGALLDTGLPDAIEFLLGVLTGGLVLGVAWLALAGVVRALRVVPARGLTLILAMLATLIALDEWSVSELWRGLLQPGSWGWPFPPFTGLTVTALVWVVLACAFGAVVLSRSRGDAFALAYRPGGVLLFALAATSVAAASWIVLSLVDDGADPYETSFRTLGPDVPVAVTPIDAPDPASRGAHEVVRLSYGAGENPRRPEFGPRRDLTSRTVDARGLLPEWKGLRGRARERYWGFGLDAAPLNALVWAPRGEGPFPLVLVVHGNHGMEDVSDPGYAYLGELLASRGFIVASVDENYVNGSWSGDFRGREMALRAWLLLEHLALWRDWSVEHGHPFAGRVDMERIALVGHSRGGEAVSIAHAFDALPRHPDDATITFDYGFDIDALVAIAQVDQRYQRRVELDDTSFLALQGSYDADEPAFHGLRQFNRIELTPGSGHFKAGLYVHGANHGQFNEGWGRKDYGPPSSWLLNLAPIIEPEVQRRVAAVSIAAFLEATLHDDDRYRALFRDPRRGAAWLPEGLYVHRYTDDSFVPVADFEEDIDVTSASLPGATIRTEGLALWREEPLRHRDDRLQGSAGAVLGWRAGARPSFELELPDGLPAPAGEGEPVLSLEIAPSPERAPDREEAADETEGASAELASPAPRASQEGPLDFEVELVTVSGRSLRLPAAALTRVAPPVKVQYMKSAALNRARYEKLWEAVLQTVEVPLEGIGAPADVRTVRLHFDGVRAGTVILDEIGMRRVRE
ncbi:MAG: hypothetical protein V2J24_02090 [Pseudomonadales bacterium]|jgi:hypothetical protein|nr:hypothetical protein [Pseudomonadales bacterium]